MTPPRTLAARGWAALGLALAVIAGVAVLSASWTQLWAWLPWSTASRLERALDERDTWRREAEKWRVAHDRQAEQVAATHRVEAEAAAAQAEIRTVYRTITERIPVYVTRESDDRCPVPVGFVRLHDHAAAGAAPPAVPDPAGQPHDAASGVALSAVAGTVAGNYEACHAVRRQLIDLQAWIRAQQALDGPAD